MLETARWTLSLVFAFLCASAKATLNFLSEKKLLRTDAIQTDLVFGTTLFKGRVERGCRAACRSPSKRCPDAAGHAACKAGGICGVGNFADAGVRDYRKSSSILL